MRNGPFTGNGKGLKIYISCGLLAPWIAHAGAAITIFTLLAFLPCYRGSISTIVRVCDISGPERKIGRRVIVRFAFSPVPSVKREVVPSTRVARHPPVVLAGHMGEV